MYTEASVKGKAVLKNGMTYSTDIEYPTGYVGNCTTSDFIKQHPDFCLRVGTISVDINGRKGPNRLGYDVFLFTFFRNGDVRPYYKNRGENYSHEPYGAELCNKDNDYKAYNAYGCAYWIMRHNNMDYKRRDVSAEW